MSKLRQLIAVTLCLVLFSSSSQAWFGFGHMAVAYVAYQQLTAQKKARVATLLKKNPYYNTKWKALIPAGTPADQRDLMLFMIAATWPDQIKSDPAFTTSLTALPAATLRLATDRHGSMKVTATTIGTSTGTTSTLLSRRTEQHRWPRFLRQMQKPRSLSYARR